MGAGTSDGASCARTLDGTDQSTSLSARALRAWTDFAEEPPTASLDAAGTAEDAEVDAVLDEFGGDWRAAMRALLHDIAVLAGDFASSVSRGYVRGGVSGRPGRRSLRR